MTSPLNVAEARKRWAAVLAERQGAQVGIPAAQSLRCDALSTRVFFAALVRRETFFEYLQFEGIQHEVLGPQYREMQGGVSFVMDGEHWVACFSRKGWFQKLVWA